jgi:hypothetical protein
MGDLHFFSSITLSDPSIKITNGKAERNTLDSSRLPCASYLRYVSVLKGGRNMTRKAEDKAEDLKIDISENTCLLKSKVLYPGANPLGIRKPHKLMADHAVLSAVSKRSSKKRR